MKRKITAANSTLANAGVPCFRDTFVQGSTLGILLNICVENRLLRKAAKRYQ